MKVTNCVCVEDAVLDVHSIFRSAPTGSAGNRRLLHARATDDKLHTNDIWRCCAYIQVMFLRMRKSIVVIGCHYVRQRFPPNLILNTCLSDIFVADTVTTRT